MIPILSGNVASALPSGYEVANSGRFNSADSAYLSRTMETATNRKKCTLSAWLKKTNIASNSTIFGGGDSVVNSAFLNFNASDQLFLQSATSDSADWGLDTDAVFRDSSAWYHVVAKIDTTQSTSTDRVKIYVNGTLQTVTGSYPSQDYDMQWSRSGEVQLVGKYPSAGIYYEGYMAEFHYVDGTAYAVSEFGEYDDDSPTIWKPKKVTGLTYGNQGFNLNFENSSELGTDVSGNSNTFSENNLDATDQATDTPTNNFCTMNSVDTNSNFTISEGNCKLAWSAAGTNFGATKATMGVSAGKRYWEVKYTYGNAGQFGFFDVNDIDTTNSTDIFSAAGNSTFEGLAWRIDSSNNIKECANGQTTDTTDDFSSGNILGIAFDADNGKIYAYQNGTEITGQNIGAGTSLMTAVTVSDFYLPFISNGDGGGGTKTGTSEVNFGGCPAFSISSGNTDANGYGNFEYAPPSGYLALCTKNLGSDGG